MTFALGEIDRRLAGLVRPCSVIALDLTADPPACRVTDGEWTSAWVRWHSPAAGRARCWRVPSLGEQGALVSPSGDVAQGTFVPGLFGDAGAAPDNRDHILAWHFEDGGVLEYDWAAKRYRIELPSGEVRVMVAGAMFTVTDSSITAEAPSLRLLGKVEVDGPLHATGDITSAGSILDTTGNSNHHKH